MNVRVKLRNGNITSIPNVHYHPSVEVYSFDNHYTLDSECWVTLGNIKKYNDQYNASMREMFPDTFEERSLDCFLADIEYAEMPFSVINAEDNGTEPWRDRGKVWCKFKHGGSDLFWKNA